MYFDQLHAKHTKNEVLVNYQWGQRYNPSCEITPGFFFMALMSGNHFILLGKL